MTACQHPVPTLSTPSVGVLSHPVTGCAHTKTKTKTLDRDLRPEEIAKAETVTKVARGLWRKRSQDQTSALFIPGPPMGCHPGQQVTPWTAPGLRSHREEKTGGPLPSPGYGVSLALQAWGPRPLRGEVALIRNKTSFQRSVFVFSAGALA